MPSSLYKSDAMYGIAVDKLCWLVSLIRCKQRICKAFHFSIYGSCEAALAAAQAWRDEAVQRHPPMLKRDKASIINKNNTTGVPGVFCLKKSDGSVVRWLAKTQLAPGNILQKSFYVSHYGAQAKAMAIAERQKQLERMEGRICLHRAASPDAHDPERVKQTILDAPLPVITREQVLRKDNRTGIAGVYLSHAPSGKELGWKAITQLGPGCRAMKEFSISVHGYGEAKEMAIAERRRQLAQKEGMRLALSAPS